MKSFAEHYRSGLKSLVRRTFAFWEKLGLHVTLNHFYSPIPDTGKLSEDLWSKRTELPGVNLREAEQLALLSDFAARYKHEYDAFPRAPTGVAHQFYINNKSFRSVDGEMLYCLIRHFKPARIFEIGSGHSTLLSAQAALKNQEETGRACELTACEPYPVDWLKRGFPGLTRLIEKKVQDVPLVEFSRLQDRDILFIDSSHTLKIDSDVRYEFLEILPRLNPGVLVHVHDIFLPGEYPREWLFGKQRFWNEQYLLQAFLCFNSGYEVVWAGSYMHYRHPELLERAFSTYNRLAIQPGSFWMRRMSPDSGPNK